MASGVGSAARVPLVSFLSFFIRNGAEFVHLSSAPVETVTCFSALSRDPREGRDSAPRAFVRRPRGVRVRGGRLSVLSLPSDVVVWFRHQVKPAPEPGLRNTPSLPVVLGEAARSCHFFFPARPTGPAREAGGARVRFAGRFPPPRFLE